VFITNSFQDLKKMRKVTVNKANMTVTAQGGCKTVDLDDAAYKQGMSVLAGVVNDTGTVTSLSTLPLR
jgi:hypothetical protein